jgi:hypothetical protein
MFYMPFQQEKWHGTAAHDGIVKPAQIKFRTQDFFGFFPQFPDL